MNECVWFGWFQQLTVALQNAAQDRIYTKDRNTYPDPTNQRYNRDERNVGTVGFGPLSQQAWSLDK
jgi:hypothetical protein